MFFGLVFLGFAALADDPDTADELLLDDDVPAIAASKPETPTPVEPLGAFATATTGLLIGLNQPLEDTYPVTDLLTGETYERTDVLRGVLHDGFTLTLGVMTYATDGRKYGVRTAFALTGEAGSFGDFDVIASGLDLRPEFVVGRRRDRAELALIVSPMSWHGTGTFASAIRYPGFGTEYAVDIASEGLSIPLRFVVALFAAVENVHATTESFGPTLNPGWVAQASVGLGAAMPLPD